MVSSEEAVRLLDAVAEALGDTLRDGEDESVLEWELEKERDGVALLVEEMLKLVL